MIRYERSNELMLATLAMMILPYQVEFLLDGLRFSRDGFGGLFGEKKHLA